MIDIDFSRAIAFYLFIFVNAVLVFWIFTRRQKDKDLTLDTKFIWFCSVCTYTYINTRQEAISACPRCGSYNKR